MKHARFESIGAHMPSTVVSTPELVDQLRNEPEFDLEAISGIRNRRVHDTRPDSYEDSYVLAVLAARDCLARSRYRADELDVVISASITRFKERDKFYFEPSFAFFLAAELGARNAIHFDVSNACAGMMTGVQVLERMIKAGVVRNGLVVSGEQATAVADTALEEIEEAFDPQFASMTVGDSAAAVVLDESISEDDRIHEIELMTCGEYSHLCIGKPSDRSQGISLYTNNREMHKEERVRMWPLYQRDLLARMGKSFATEGYDYLVHHQVGTKAIRNFTRGGAAVFEAEMPPNLTVVEEYANTASTSHFVVLHEHLKNKSVPKGSKFLLVPAASGLVTGFLSTTITSVEV